MKKNIIVSSLCLIVIVAVAIAAYMFLKAPAPKKTTQTSQNEARFSGNIDEAAIEELNKRKDYGTPPMDNIGRENPFAGI